jgi:hypothetical protein
MVSHASSHAARSPARRRPRPRTVPPASSSAQPPAHAAPDLGDPPRSALSSDPPDAPSARGPAAPCPSLQAVEHGMQSRHMTLSSPGWIWCLLAASRRVRLRGGFAGAGASRMARSPHCPAPGGRGWLHAGAARRCAREHGSRATCPVPRRRVPCLLVLCGAAPSSHASAGFCWRGAGERVPRLPWTALSRRIDCTHGHDRVWLSDDWKPQHTRCAELRARVPLASGGHTSLGGTGLVCRFRQRRRMAKARLHGVHPTQTRSRLSYRSLPSPDDKAP